MNNKAKNLINGYWLLKKIIDYTNDLMRMSVVIETLQSVKRLLNKHNRYWGYSVNGDGYIKGQRVTNKTEGYNLDDEGFNVYDRELNNLAVKIKEIINNYDFLELETCGDGHLVIKFTDTSHYIDLDLI